MRYYAGFPLPIPHLGVRSIVLLTLAPLALAGPFDLHALATPPAFSLSQNQTLQLFFVALQAKAHRKLRNESLTCEQSFFMNCRSFLQHPG